MNQTAAPLLEPALLQRLEQLSVAARRVRLGAAKGERLSKRKGGSTEFADYRDYVQGDDLRHVDWNIYSRLNALYLKLFQDQEDLTLSLLLDASASMNFGTPTKWRFAQTLAAAVGYIALAGYDRVSVSIQSGDATRYLPSCRGRASAPRLFDFIGQAESNGETDLESLCRAHALRQTTPGVALIISDFFDANGFQHALRRLSASRAEGHVIHVLAPEEIDPRLTGDLKLVDSETHASTEISVTPGLLKRYQKEREEFCAAIRDHCVARNIGYFSVSSAMPVEELTLNVLRRGGMLR